MPSTQLPHFTRQLKHAAPYSGWVVRDAKAHQATMTAPRRSITPARIAIPHSHRSLLDCKLPVQGPVPVVLITIFCLQVNRVEVTRDDAWIPKGGSKEG